MRVVERIRRSGIGLRPDQTVGEAAAVMDSAGVGAVVVVDAGRAIGIVTDRDLVRRVLARRLPADARIDSVMSGDPATIDADADVHDAYDLIRSRGVRRLVVVDQGRFTGMVTVDDLLIELAQDLHDLARTVAAEIHRPDRDAEVPATL